MIKIKDFIEVLPKYISDCNCGKKNDCILSGIRWIIIENGNKTDLYNKNLSFAVNHRNIRNLLKTKYADYLVNIPVITTGAYGSVHIIVEVINPEEKKGE